MLRYVKLNERNNQQDNMYQYDKKNDLHQKQKYV